jgi:chaperonin GroES
MEIFRDGSSIWSGTEVKVDGKDLLIMKESDIMGIIEK